MEKKNRKNRRFGRTTNLKALIEKRVNNFLSRRLTPEEKKIVLSSKDWNDLWKDHDGGATLEWREKTGRGTVMDLLLHGLPVPFPHIISRHLIRPFSGYYDACRNYHYPKHMVRM